MHPQNDMELMISTFKDQVTIHPGQTNTVILTELENPRIKVHLMTGLEKQKCTRAMENEIGHILQGIIYI